MSPRLPVSPSSIRMGDTGSLEITLMALKLAESGRYDGVIAFGLIVDGGIYRHEFVASSVIDGLVKVQLDTGIPVFSCVLTPHHFHEHSDHLEFFGRHLEKKGKEVAESAFSFINTLATLGGTTVDPAGEGAA